MKLSLLIVLLALVLVSNASIYTNQECSRACKEDHSNRHVGGRTTSADEKGEYGFNSDRVDCTCMFPFVSVQNERKCDQYCNIQRYTYKFCHFLAVNTCLLYVGLVY